VTARAGRARCCVPLLALLALVGCETTPRPQPPSANGGTGGPSIPVAPLAYDDLPQRQWTFLTESGLRDSLAVVVRDSAAWAGLWRAIVSANARDTSDIAVAPPVDFRQVMVLGYGLGQSMTMGAWRLEVASARLRNDTLIVRIDKRVPSARCFPTNDGGESPVALATTPRREGPVRFELDTVDAGCVGPAQVRRPGTP
jgi:hypothetical protein